VQTIRILRAGSEGIIIAGRYSRDNKGRDRREQGQYRRDKKAGTVQ
jgi:hypothetical protein